MKVVMIKECLLLEAVISTSSLCQVLVDHVLYCTRSAEGKLHLNYCTEIST